MKKTIHLFPKNFWTVIFMEFTERGSYYGVMSILAIYLSVGASEGGLGLGKEASGNIMSIITPIIYVIPILAGVIADRYGYRRLLGFAFAAMSFGYALTAYSSSYYGILASLMVVAVGAGTFKPIVSGTIALETNEKTSSMGFGIFYWSVNMGSFVFPLVFVPYLKAISYSYVFLLAAVCTAMLLLVNLFVFKEPKRPASTKTIGQVLINTFSVLKDVKFVMLIVIYSGFWIMYFQMYGSVLFYLTEHVDTTQLDAFINSILSVFIENPSWHFDVEYVTVMNSFTIITLQLVISNIVKHTKALPTMLTGILIGSVGMAMLAISSSIWVFLFGIIVFSIGEMTAQPKFISYVGQVAPPDKKALYMGYSFLYGVIGSGVGLYIGPKLYIHFIEQQNSPVTLWLLFASIGVATAILLVIYNKLVLKSNV